MYTAWVVWHRKDKTRLHGVELTYSLSLIKQVFVGARNSGKMHCTCIMYYSLNGRNHAYVIYVIFRDFRRSLEYRPLHPSDQVKQRQISVCVRKRPLNSKGEVTRVVCSVVAVANLQNFH